ncbi:Imm63 family immunity protein [Mucilaginibacter sp. UYCu711]|uniref:Imm63 family immunity protein n=1 Tax=Mucilaginibacter sp. UYCu711 TaxID=3156339 RepID=UPI003D1A0BF5
MRIEIVELEKKVRNVMGSINAPDYMLPTFSDDERDARDSQPLVLDNVINDRYLAYERGNLLFEKITTEIDELYFWIFESITFSVSFQYAAEFGKNKEQRIDAFEKQIELLTQIKIKDRFIERLKTEYNKILGYKLFPQVTNLPEA